MRQSYGGGGWNWGLIGLGSWTRKGAGLEVGPLPRRCEWGPSLLSAEMDLEHLDTQPEGFLL